MYLTLNFRKFETENIINYLNENTHTKTLTEKDEQNQEKNGFYQFPQQTTFGFKQILGRIFCNVFYWEKPNIDSTHTIESISFLVSTSEELDKMEEDDLIIVINIKSDKFSLEQLRNSISAFNNQKNKNANEFFNAILGFKLDKVFNDVTTGKYNAKCIEYNDSKEFDATYSVLSGFYYYAFILQYRLERMQVAADVSGSNFNKEVIKQKTFLLNLNRFFLTPNRSENKSIKEFADKVMEQFKLSNNIKIRSKNVDFFDDLVVRKISDIDKERKKVIDATMNLIKFLGVPLVVFSTLMALNLNAPVVIGFPETIIGVLLLFGLSVFLPMLVFYAQKIYYYFKNNNAKN